MIELVKKSSGSYDVRLHGKYVGFLVRYGTGNWSTRFNSVNPVDGVCETQVDGTFNDCRAGIYTKLEESFALAQKRVNELQARIDSGRSGTDEVSGMEQEKATLARWIPGLEVVSSDEFVAELQAQPKPVWCSKEAR